MSRLLLAVAVGILMIGGESATAARESTARKVQNQNKKNQNPKKKGQGRLAGEQDLHTALRHTHAAAKEEKTPNAKGGALANTQAAIRALHAAAQAFGKHHKANGGKAGTHHPAHPHIMGAIKDLQAAEKRMAAGNVGQSEKDFHKASVQIQDAIKAHQLHHKKK